MHITYNACAQRRKMISPSFALWLPKIVPHTKEIQNHVFLKVSARKVWNSENYCCQNPADSVTFRLITLILQVVLSILVVHHLCNSLKIWEITTFDCENSGLRNNRVKHHSMQLREHDSDCQIPLLETQIQISLLVRSASVWWYGWTRDCSLRSPG